MPIRIYDLVSNLRLRHGGLDSNPTNTPFPLTAMSEETTAACPVTRWHTTRNTWAPSASGSPRRTRNSSSTTSGGSCATRRMSAPVRTPARYRPFRIRRSDARVLGLLRCAPARSARAARSAPAAAARLCLPSFFVLFCPYFDLNLCQNFLRLLILTSILQMKRRTAIY
jgi:hypothetical protein